jgi:hypothetical protein
MPAEKRKSRKEKAQRKKKKSGVAKASMAMVKKIMM